MTYRLNTGSGFVTLLAAYAPTLKSSPELKYHFYDQLNETAREAQSSDRLTILSDFNARVSQSQTLAGVHGYRQYQ